MSYYKKKEYVEKSINSVLSQTFQDFELLIVYDDESKKDLEYLKSLVEKDKRIKLIINDKNLGAGESRNKAIKHCKGNLIAFIDSDDLWEKDKLELQIEFMEDNHIKICHTSYKIIDKNSNEIGSRKSKKVLNYKDLLKSCDIGLSTVLMDKDLIDEYFSFANLKTKEDYVLWLKLAKSGVEIKLIDKKLSSWRKVNNSLSSSVKQKLFDGFFVYYNFMEFNIFKSFFCLIRLSIYSLFK